MYIENIEKLPIMKTAWAAHRQFFSKFFTASGFFNFMLPVLLLSSLASYFRTAFEIAKFSGLNEFSDLAFYLIVTLLNIILGFIVAVKWHRHMILDESVDLKTKGQWAYIKGFFLKSIWISILMILIYAPIVAVSFVVMKMFQMHGGVDLPIWAIAIGSIAFVALLVKAIFVSVALYLTLPAAAVGVKLKVREVLKATCGMRGRLIVTSFVTGLPILLFIFIIAFGTIYLNFSIFNEIADDTSNSGNLLLISIFVSMFAVVFAGFWGTLAGVGVLSIFYMHYIVPQLPTIEKEHEAVVELKDG
jgi:hypothetical protein